MTFGTKVSPEFGGYLAGGQAGYNVQTGRMVVGVEVDYGFSNAQGGKSCPNAFYFTCEADVDHLARSRGGWATPGVAPYFMARRAGPSAKSRPARI